ncbi:MAG: HEAT repeat domain-containing protein [Planctomycetota bacterium]
MVRRPTTFSLSLALAAAAASPATAQHGQSDDPKAPMYVAPRGDDVQNGLKQMQLADGLVADLVASEPDVCNGVALALDDRGRLYLCETFRIGDGVFDNRSYMQWKDRDLACKTVADREAVYREFLPDRIDSLLRNTERVRMLADTDNNGTFDRVTVFAEGWNALADGIVSGVLPVGDDVWVTNIPKLWRLRDQDGDGVAEQRTAVHDGFGVHTSLIGHDMHGLIVGPDRRLYFSIGDRGIHVDQPNGPLDYPDEGVVMRCELDGSDLEVVHRGLRNPQELAFDQWGDLFTGDNNSDSGDRARLVQIVPGADSGWRIGYQWLDDRGTWNRDQLWHPRHATQTAGILPPIANFADGPSGLCYDTGTGLPERFRDCFFLCDFRGGPSYSGIRTFRLQRRGAGYELLDHDKLAWNVLATDCDFGPDGSLYVYDWVNGWGKSGKGRVYRLRTKEMANDLQLRNTARLLAADLTQRGEQQLQPLLAHADRRVRQKAQFALVDLGAASALEAATANRQSRVGRLHGVWGLGVLLRQGKTTPDVLRALLGDDDGDVRAMAARALGDAREHGSLGALRKLLRDGNARAQREAALAIERLGQRGRAAADDLLTLLRENDDQDAVLRHAAAFALAATADGAWLLGHADDPSRAVQRGVLLALARQGDAEVARFLKSPDEQLRFEAARAIYDAPIPAAMRALAELANDDHPDSARIDWRALNANRMRGEVENGEILVHIARQQNHPAETRIDALRMLAEWRAPHGQCRVTGLWRPCQHPDADIVAQCLRGAAPELLTDPVVAAATAAACAGLGVRDVAAELVALTADQAMSPDARIAGIDALATLDAPELQQALASIGADAPVRLRKRAVALLSKSAPEQAVPVLATLLDNAPQGERQAALEALGKLQHAAATAVLRSWLEKLEQDQVPVALQLDLLEAATRHDALRGAVDAWVTAADGAAPQGSWRVCLDGGDAKAGRKVFYDHEATRCTRCHTLDGTGGNAGPVLSDVGKRLPPEQLLESLLQPSAKIADGFGTVALELTDASMAFGVVTREADGVVTIVDLTGKATDVPVAKIRRRTASTTSAMPPMGGPLSKTQLRDLIAFLKQRKG